MQGGSNYTLYVQGSGPRFSGILATAPPGFPCTPFNTALATIVSTMSFPAPTAGSGSLGRLYTSLLNTTQGVNASLGITRTLLQAQLAASQSTLNTSIQQLSAGLTTAQSVSSANSQALQTLSNSLNTQVGWSWVKGQARGIQYVLFATDAPGARTCFIFYASNGFLFHTLALFCRTMDSIETLTRFLAGADGVLVHRLAAELHGASTGGP